MSVWLDGAGLEDLSPRIKIKQIEPGACALSQTTAEDAKYSGARFLAQREGARTVKVVFRVLEKDGVRRRQILDDIVAWARGSAGAGDGPATPGVSGARCSRLEIADEPDKYLPVRCTALPYMRVQQNYAEDLSVTFTAFRPGWRATVPETVTLQTKAGTPAVAFVNPAGTEELTFLEFELVNRGPGAMQTATVTVNGRWFAFTGLGLAPGKALTASYDLDERLSLSAGGASAMDRRSAQSADDLLLWQRRPNKVTVTTASPADVKLIGRGRYR